MTLVKIVFGSALGSVMLAVSALVTFAQEAITEDSIDQYLRAGLSITALGGAVYFFRWSFQMVREMREYTGQQQAATDHERDQLNKARAALDAKEAQFYEKQTEWATQLAEARAQKMLAETMISRLEDQITQLIQENQKLREYRNEHPDS